MKKSINILFIGMTFIFTYVALAEDDLPKKVSLYDYMMDESVKYAGQKTRPVNVDEPSYVAVDVNSSQDSYLQVDELRAAGGGRWQTRGSGNSDDQKELYTELIAGGSVHFLSELISFYLLAATGDSIRTRRQSFLEGAQSDDFEFHVRNLYTTVMPLKGLRATAGSFSPYYALGTQSTLKDQDAYVAGYRVQVDLQELLQNSLANIVRKITLESSYYGDITKPNVFNRLERLSTEDNNSHGGFVESGEFYGVSVAVGLENFEHRNYLPIQGQWKIENVVLKSITGQCRLDLKETDHSAYAIHAKVNPLGSLHNRLQVKLGVTVISDDDTYPGSDQYPAGERFDVTLAYLLPYGFSIGGFYSDDFKDILKGEKIDARATLCFDPLTLYDEYQNPRD